MMDLREILRGHEKEIFYSTIFGNVKLLDTTHIIENFPLKLVSLEHNDIFYLTKFGQYSNEGECVLFPSKDQRDWETWTENNKYNKSQFPKIWSELVKQERITHAGIAIAMSHDERLEDLSETDYDTPIEKAAFALLKIHQLIEEWYGRNVTNKERRCTVVWSLTWGVNNTLIPVCFTKGEFNHISFHTKKQAVEFISYPENVQLVKDFYMLK